MCSTLALLEALFWRYAASLAESAEICRSAYHQFGGPSATPLDRDGEGDR